MKNFSFAILSNTLSLLFIGFLIVFFILNYFMNYKLAIILSSTLSFIICIFYIMFATNKRNKNQKDAFKNKDLEQAFIELNFSNKQDIIARFTRAFEKQNKSVKKLSSSIFVEQDNLIIYFAFGFDGVKKSDIIKAYNLIKKGERIKIFCSSCSEDVKVFIKRFNGFISLENRNAIYSLLDDTDEVPKPTHILQEENHKKRATFRNFFERKKAKSFLTFGLTLSFMSLFVRYKLYYLISGTIFLSFFLIAFFFGKREVKN